MYVEKKSVGIISLLCQSLGSVLSKWTVEEVHFGEPKYKFQLRSLAIM